MTATASILSTPVAVCLLLIVAIRLEIVAAFQLPVTQKRCLSAIHFSDSDTIFGPRVDDGEDVVLYSDDDDSSDSESWGPSSSSINTETTKTRSNTMSRWDSLNPKIKGMQIYFNWMHFILALVLILY